MISLCMCVRMYINRLLMHCSLASLYLEVLGCSWVGVGCWGQHGASCSSYSIGGVCLVGRWQ